MSISNLQFNEIDAAKIYAYVITTLEQGVNEPLYPGDERRLFAEALVPVLVALLNTINDAAKQKMLYHARGDVLDALGERVGVTREAAQPAKVTLRFSVKAVMATNIVIPAGTRVTPNQSVYFATDESAVLQAGNLYVDVSATSTTGGAAYNGYAAGTLSTMVDIIPFIDSVTNTIASYGGDDGEPYNDTGDSKLRERIRIAPSKFSVAGPDGAYRYHALSADPTVIDVSVSSPTPGVVKVVPVLVNGGIPSADVIEKVRAAVCAPDIRPLTDQVLVQAPTRVVYDIEIKYYTTEQAETEVVENIEGAGGAIKVYRAWQSGALGRDINPDQLRKHILSPSWSDDLTGALRVDIIKPVYTQLDEVSVAVFSGNLTVTHAVVKE